MVGQQLRQQIERAPVTGVDPRGRNETLRGFLKSPLALERDAQILVGVWTCGVDFDGPPAINLTLLKTAQGIKRVAQVIVDEVPRRSADRLQRQGLAVVTDRG